MDVAKHSAQNHTSRDSTFPALIKTVAQLLEKLFWLMEQANKIFGKKALRNLEILRKSGILTPFYLAGGTGAALILGHRLSRDFDFFSRRLFNEHLLIRKLSRIGKFHLEKKAEGTVNGLWNGSRVSFFAYSYRLLRPTNKVLGVNVADLTDIACMKLDAISSRGSKRDFVDLYWIMHERDITLKALFAFFRKKYAGARYNFLHIKKGLIYFEDADREPMPMMLKHTAWKDAKEFFKQEIRSNR
jgi:hypothetical protein